jgi:class 3 adenylate cyclase
MLAQFDEIDKFARKCFHEANDGAKVIRFSLTENEHYSKGGRDIKAAAPYSIGNTPRFVELDNFRGVGGWAVVLSVDLRGSSKRATEIGAEDTYLTMHTYLPTMAELVSKANGKIGSLRGDGLFAVFGFTEYTDDQKTLPEGIGKVAIQNATRCGKAMIETTVDILNPIMEENDILGELRIGVGICVGDVVVTQIGIGDAIERTLYGTPVNNACKASTATNEMILTNQAEALFPSSKGGQVKFKPINLGGSLGGQIIKYPPGYIVLERNSNMIGKTRPR